MSNYNNNSTPQNNREFGDRLTTPKPEAVERVGPEIPVISYSDYQFVCNYHNDGSRRRGILSGEAYEAILEDQDTGYIEMRGHRVPALISLDHGLSMGYDSSRCQELAGEAPPRIRFLALPVHELDDTEKDKLASLLLESKFELYFSDHGGDEPGALADILDRAGLSHTEKALTDPRAARGDEQAAMYLYSCLAEQNSERGERQELKLSDVQEYYDRNVGPSYTPDGAAMSTLNVGDRISDQEAEEMWLIYDEMFNVLGGDGHPISMQDTKEDFYRLLRSEDTMVASTYKVSDDGDKELTCFTYFIDNVDDLYWLNQEFFKKNSQDNPAYVTDIFTPGLVSKGTDRMYAPLSIGLFARVADEAGMSANVTFENTNLSKRYVPRFVDHAMARECRYTTVDPSKVLDKVTYRLWSIGE